MNETSDRASPAKKLPLILLLCAFAVPIVLANRDAEWTPSLNAAACRQKTYDCFMYCGLDREGHPVIQKICPDDMEPVYGDFSWRFLQRGIIAGARAGNTPLASFLRELLGYERGDYAVRLLNPLNPTPFLISVFLLGGTLVSRVYGKHKSERLVELRMYERGAVETKSGVANGGSPLHIAVIKNQKDEAELLLANGADVNAKDNDGETPLHYAAFKGHLDLVKLLLSNNADVNAKDDDGETPLRLAALEGHKDVTELLGLHGGRTL